MQNTCFVTPRKIMANEVSVLEKTANLTKCALNSADFVIDGSYTIPRTWAVYRIPTNQNKSSNIYRMGNHPVRKNELEREFGEISVVAIFNNREMAKELSIFLNKTTK
jgi:hypothetical protein